MLSMNFLPNILLGTKFVPLYAIFKYSSSAWFGNKFSESSRILVLANDKYINFMHPHYSILILLVSIQIFLNLEIVDKKRLKPIGYSDKCYRMILHCCPWLRAWNKGSIKWFSFEIKVANVHKVALESHK